MIKYWKIFYLPIFGGLFGVPDPSFIGPLAYELLAQCWARAYGPWPVALSRAKRFKILAFTTVTPLNPSFHLLLIVKLVPHDDFSAPS